jgi:hypothetical protein
MKQDETYKRIVRNDKRYDNIFDQMELLGIKDVSTPRQCKNGTVVWRLPIKYSTHPKFIEVASFATGYVRNQNGGYTNYQLNKRCEGKPEYFQLDNGDFRKFTTRSCVLIPNEIDRLEYLISYCLKNYYIKNANQVINGKYISKWEHEYKLERQSNTANHQFEMNALQNKLANSVPKWKYDEAIKLGKTTWQSKNVEKIADLEDRIYELTSQVDVGEEYTINLKAQLHASQEELAATKVRQDVSVIVNGHRYKVL